MPRGRAGAGRLRSLLEDRGAAPALESRLEVRIWSLLRRAGLRPARQHRVTCRGRRFRLDFAWPALRVAVEGDGYGAHGGHDVFERDELRRALLAAEGWLVVPVTWRQVADDPDGVVDRVRHAVRAAAA